MPEVTRRQLLVSLSALAAVMARPVRAALAAQPVSPPIHVRSLNHFAIAVSDPKRTIDFYQGLFGMPVQARTGTTTVLRVGTGPQFLSIGPVPAGAAPSITHYCLGVEDFTVDRIMMALAAHGISKADAVGPMKANISIVSSLDGRADLPFGDPDGIVCQLQDVNYCGGSGGLGNRCASPDSPPTKGLIPLIDVSHLTNVKRRAPVQQVLPGPLRPLGSRLSRADVASTRHRTGHAVPDVHRRRHVDTPAHRRHQSRLLESRQLQTG